MTVPQTNLITASVTLLAGGSDGVGGIGITASMSCRYSDTPAHLLKFGFLTLILPEFRL